MRRDKEIPFESGECVTAQYKLNADGTVQVDNNQFYGYYDGSSDMQGGLGEAQINNWFGGKLYVYFFAQIGGLYRILDTDYTNYAVIWTCEDFAGIRYDEAAWVLTRTALVDGSSAWNSMYSTADAIYKSHVPDYDHANRMRTTQQGGSCSYFTT